MIFFGTVGSNLYSVVILVKKSNLQGVVTTTSDQSLEGESVNVFFNFNYGVRSIFF